MPTREAVMRHRGSRGSLVRRTQSCKLASCSSLQAAVKAKSRDNPPPHPAQHQHRRYSTQHATIGPSVSETTTRHQEHQQWECIRNFASTKRGVVVNRGDSFQNTRKYSVRSCMEFSQSGKEQARRYSLQSPFAGREAHLGPLVVTRGLVGGGGDRQDNFCSTPDHPISHDTAGCGGEKVTSKEDGGSIINDTLAHHVVVVGACCVGKSSVIRQFQTSEYTNGVDHYTESCDSNVAVTVCLDECTVHLNIEEVTVPSPEDVYVPPADVHVVMYSVDSAESFATARVICATLRQHYNITQPIILAANKSDLVRKRKISNKEGRAVAVRHSCKHIDTSVVIGCNIDQLLAGVAAQCRLTATRREPNHHRPRHTVGEGDDGKSSSKSSSPARHHLFRSLVDRLILRRDQDKYCQNLFTR